MDSGNWQKMEKLQRVGRPGTITVTIWTQTEPWKQMNLSRTGEKPISSAAGAELIKTAGRPGTEKNITCMITVQPIRMSGWKPEENGTGSRQTAPWQWTRALHTKITCILWTETELCFPDAGKKKTEQNTISGAGAEPARICRWKFPERHIISDQTVRW